MMPSAKHLDILLGIDIHLVIIPPSPSPVPLPHPFIGFVFDPMDYIQTPLTGAKVWVNGLPRAQAGTNGNNKPQHIPLGTKFFMPSIANQGEVFMGSATVLVEDEPFGYMALPVLSCSDVGIPPPFRIKGKKETMLSLPTSVVLPIPMGNMVLVGGPPTISMMGLAFKGIFAGLGFLNFVRKNSKLWKKLADKVHQRASNTFKKLVGNARNCVSRLKCAITGHPVDIATGKVFTEHVDFELPGPIPLRWERVWYSTSSYQGPLGHGWHHLYDLHLTEDARMQKLVLRTADGRNAVFPQLDVGEESHIRQERLTLRRDEDGYALRDADWLEYRFNAPAQTTPDLHPLASITDRVGHQIRFSYNKLGHLQEILDSAGRVLHVQCDVVGRITSILAPHPELPGETFPIVRYSYDGLSNLLEVRDALDQPFRYRYARHLLVQETNRNGLNFYFEYDGTDETARCIRTWGDGGIYDHKLTYFTAENYTIVENSLGHRSTYHWNEDGLVYRTIDPLGHETRQQYDAACRVLQEQDELGQMTLYTYDEQGNRSGISKPDGTQVQLQYDEHNQLLSLTNEIGAQWRWVYDDLGQLLQRTDPLGNTTQYEHEAGQLAEIIDALGGKTLLHYDAQRNPIAVTTPDNMRSEWQYDALGRCVAVLDPKGNVQRRQFDGLGQLVQVWEPDGNERQLRYNGEGDVIHVRNQHHDVKFEYRGMGRLAAREEAGTRVEFEYNTEEDLTGIRNEHGFVYSFELDERGDVTEEKGFDGLLRRYFRDAAGCVSQVERSGGQRMQYEYDALGRILAVRYPDGTTDQFRYRADGELLEASNVHSQVLFERDALGQILAEIQGDITITSAYDALGRRTRVTSSLGAKLHFGRNLMGDVERVSAEGSGSQWEAGFRRDELGLELERLLPGGLRSQWQRDRLGRPVEQRLVAAGGNVRRTRHYTWDVNDRLRKILDSAQGVTQFDHDVFGNLASANYGDNQPEYRMPDAVGNLFRRSDRSDRKYGPAGQLLEADGRRYRYDAEGNLTRKVEATGRIWRYAWNAAGMLAQVTRPDGQTVTFTYDALGRRLTKTYRNKTTHWAWDGNVPLHEWTEKLIVTQVYADDDRIAEALKEQRTALFSAVPGNGPPEEVITWVFEPESFAPIAKLNKTNPYSIVTDHLGTPLSMLNEAGETVWQMELSIYGEVRNLNGWREACPFRYPGQYEDVETGLYYNRFRYYDPEGGFYVSQDPIRLDGYNPNIYGYVFDCNVEFDPFGLECKGWRKARKKYWKDKHAAELLSPSGKYSPANMARMQKGKPPRIRVEVSDAFGNKRVVDVPIELHHTYLPQRSGSKKAHEAWNLTEVTPWGHSSMDPYRHLGDDSKLERIINGTNSWQ